MISHLALIMDGNRRWAKKNSLFPWQGHKKGIDNVEMSIQFCMEQGIKFLSLYTFSLENVNRPETEKKYLFKLIDTMKDRVQEFVDKNIKICFIGDRSVMDESLRMTCDNVELATKDCTALQCNFLFFYGGRQEIVFAARALQKSGEEITESSLRKNLWSGDIPYPELVVRTGGHQRLSNFLLFQIAYAEIKFLKVLWPDFTKHDLKNLLDEHATIQKNIGR